MIVIPFDIIVLILGLSVYSMLPSKGKTIFTFVAWIMALAVYYCLWYIWWVMLDGWSWVQWFFGFAIFMSVVPALGVVAAQLSFRNIFPKE